MHLLMIRRLVALSALALVFAACGGDDSSSSANDATTTTTAGQTTTSAPSTGAATLAVADGHLVDADGMSVYFFEKDQGTTSACMDQCAQAWPAVVATGGKPTAGSELDASKLSTADGQVADQVVYNGHLLYTFSGDKAPGDTNGKSIPSWYLLDASGEEIEAG